METCVFLVSQAATGKRMIISIFRDLMHSQMGSLAANHCLQRLFSV
jgi:hypothetical protein